MPKLKANFVADWVAHLRLCLINEQKWPLDEVSRLSDSDIPHHYFDAQRRRITNTPRTIKIGDNFVCPPEHEIGWAILQEKVREGKEINSYLSKGHASLHNHDGLLAEWGVHHFHLGAAPCTKTPTYMGRTGPLLYALVTNETFYAINIYNHDSFADEDVLESIHRNWPEIISRYRAKGITGAAWDKKKRKELRSANLNTSTLCADGTVYLPIGKGVTLSGMSIEAIYEADYWHLKIKRFQSDFENQITTLVPDLMEHGYTGEEMIQAELQFFSLSDRK